MSKLKSYPSLPVHIVEYHNDALPHLYRAIGSKHLPLNDLTLVHFDSHPDLGVPSELYASDCYKKDVLFSKLSIENWILPAAFAGHIATIIWCKPKWANQMACGTHEFFVGEDSISHKLKVTSSDSYFVSDCVHQKAEVLVNKKAITLHVVELSKHDDTDNLMQRLGNNQYILDVDLDFFSTKNPFLEMFSAADLNELTRLYLFEFYPHQDVMEVQEHRGQQLEELNSWLAMIRDGRDCSGHNENERFQSLKKIVKNFELNNANNMLTEDDYEILHGSGCASGEPPLPHHVSSETDIDQLVGIVEKSLKAIKHPPLLVTVARSSIDDYCPPHQVDAIQEKIESMFGDLYSPVTFHHHYKDTDDG